MLLCLAEERFYWDVFREIGWFLEDICIAFAIAAFLNYLLELHRLELSRLDVAIDWILECYWVILEDGLLGFGFYYFIRGAYLKLIEMGALLRRFDGLKAGLELCTACFFYSSLVSLLPII